MSITEVRIKAKIGNSEIEITCDKSAFANVFADLVDKLQGKNVLSTSIIEHRTPISKDGKDNMTNRSEIILIPSVEMLVGFILQQPNYSFTIYDVEDYFLGHHIKVRDHQGPYRRLSDNLKVAMRRIERAKQGNFEDQRTGTRNLKRHVFKPLHPNTLPLENNPPSTEVQTSQKTS